MVTCLTMGMMVLQGGEGGSLMQREREEGIGTKHVGKWRVRRLFHIHELAHSSL